MQQLSETRMMEKRSVGNQPVVILLPMIKSISHSSSAGDKQVK